VLWDEVKDRLDLLGTRLSGGQQQRLTLARALSLEPEILCLDEFSIAIDPVTTMRIEEVLKELKGHMTIVLVTNLVQQARRLADQDVFLNASRWWSTAPPRRCSSARSQPWPRSTCAEPSDEPPCHPPGPAGAPRAGPQTCGTASSRRSTASRLDIPSTASRPDRPLGLR
jgi:ABC-type multidrug transport system ATPase subunit